jgi:hypothetical protein
MPTARHYLGIFVHDIWNSPLCSYSVIHVRAPLHSVQVEVAVDSATILFESKISSTKLIIFTLTLVQCHFQTITDHYL